MCVEFSVKAAPLSCTSVLELQEGGESLITAPTRLGPARVKARLDLYPLSSINF